MNSGAFQPGEVVICVREAGAPWLRKGRLYRISRQVPGCLAYELDGVTPPGVAGFWGNRFGPVAGQWTRQGPIRRTAR